MWQVLTVAVLSIAALLCHLLPRTVTARLHPEDVKLMRETTDQMERIGDQIERQVTATGGNVELNLSTADERHEDRADRALELMMQERTNGQAEW